MSRETAVQLSDEIFDRLQALATKTGRTTTSYIREAIEEHIEDLEDLYLAEAAIERINRGESKIVDAEEFWRGLDD